MPNQNKRISVPIRWTNPWMPGLTTGRRIGRDVPWIQVYKQSYKNSMIFLLNHHHWRDSLELPHQWLIIDNMPSTCSSPILKKEFIEVITDSNLTPTPTSHSCEFSFILTETSLLDTETPISPIPHVDLIEYYDQMFPTLKLYKNFIDRRLGIWEHDWTSKIFWLSILSPMSHHQLHQNTEQSGTKTIRRSQSTTRKKTLPPTRDQSSPSHHQSTQTLLTPL